MTKKILITGAAGFIGSHLTYTLFKKYKKSKFILYDKLTYAAKKIYIKKILKSSRVKFIQDDILNFKILSKNLKGVDIAINVAAESHVDNSFGNSLLFTKTNTLGTHSFLEACRKQKVKKIIHVSTDEVYGENLGLPFSEKKFLNPTNPYSASKAGGDMMVNSYVHSYKLPIIVVRANNIFGTRQYPEKLISKTIVYFIKKKKMTLHGNGKNFRYFLSVHDFCEGILKLINRGKKFEIYNIASDKVYKVTDIVKMISNIFKIEYKKNICFVNDRPFNDKIYKISCSKLKKLGWRPKRSLENEISDICKWYKKNVNLY